MLRNSWILALLLHTLVAAAQEDAVLMRINGKEVLRSEFERRYPECVAPAGAKQNASDNCLDRFIDFQLKVAAAEEAGLDTLQAFRHRLEDYRIWLSRSYLNGEEAWESMARDVYRRMYAGRRSGQNYVSHIFKYLPQNISGSALREAEARMDSLYDVLKRGGADAGFDALVEQFSDEKAPFLTGQTQMPVEFENVVRSLQPGEISRPFLTPQGIHIVKLLERRDSCSFEEVRSEIIHRLERRGAGRELDARVEELKRAYHYTLHREGMDELVAKGRTTLVLFTLAGKEYTGETFARFAAAHPQGIQRQLKAFIRKSVLDCEYSHLEQNHSEFRLRMQEYRDSMLLSEITEREIAMLREADKAGVEGYFETHRSDYRWPEFRYRGVVLHCTTKRVAKQALRFLKQLPEEEWTDAIRLAFNTGDVPELLAEQGTFTRGDNAHVDERVFKAGKATPVPAYPFTAILGKKLRGPQDYREVGDRLDRDYRNHLERRWMEKVRARSKVEINQEVLKTVNNH